MTPYQRGMLGLHGISAQADLTRAKGALPTALDIEEQQARIDSAKALAEQRREGDPKKKLEIASINNIDRKRERGEDVTDLLERHEAFFGGGGTSVTTTINTGDVEKSTKGKIEQDLIDLNKATGDLENVRDAYQDKFSTYGFRGRKWLGTKTEKLGPGATQLIDAVAPGVRASKEEITAYTDWYQSAKQAFLTFRKWATGVAGGPQEMAEIAKAFPEPDNLSPTEFKAAVDASIKYRNAYRATLEEYLKTGAVITPEAKRAASRAALQTVRGQAQARQVPSNTDMLNALNIIKKQMPNATPQEQAAAARALLDGQQAVPSNISPPQLDTLDKGGIQLR
jgi:hypothetical protein